MLLAIDIGNTNIKYAIFNGEELVGTYRVSSRLTRTADEYGAVLLNLLDSSNIYRKDITGIIICVAAFLLVALSGISPVFAVIAAALAGILIGKGKNLNLAMPKKKN